MKILILGATGMSGNTIFRHLYNESEHEIWGSYHKSTGREFFISNYQSQLIGNINVLEYDALVDLISKVQPDFVINCVGIINKLEHVNNPLVVMPVNAIFPHRLAKLCKLAGARLIHISTDCVFSGQKGLYKESEVSDAKDLYGKSKSIGELKDYSNVITLRTSIIGHELHTKYGLLEWFLSQEGTVKGYTNAIFSGLSTLELARVIKDYILSNKVIEGLYHVSLEPIDKCSLLSLVKKIYGKTITLVPDNTIKINRSLDSSLFKSKTGYTPPSWENMILDMYNDYTNEDCYIKKSGANS